MGKLANFIKEDYRKSKCFNSGYSLVEVLFYVFLLALVLLVIINIMVIVLNSQREFKVSKNIENASITILERMTREIRNAESINLAGSNLGVNPGVLMLDTEINEVTTTIRFYASSSELSIDEGGVYDGPITIPGVSVSNLIFRKIENSVSEAVKIELTLTSGTGANAISVPFYSTVTLRGSY